EGHRGKGPLLAVFQHIKIPATSLSIQNAETSWGRKAAPPCRGEAPVKPCRAIVPIVAGSLAITLGLGAAPASSQDYPSRPIKIIVPVAPGGLVDILPRIFGQKITESTTQPVIVENHPGAGGSIGAAEVSKSPPDGYTLMMGFHAVLAILPHLSSKL